MLVMNDDGMHNDGEANDNVYAASFTFNSSYAEYYVVALNNAAASFMPERAEFELYTLESSLKTPATGEVVINEFIAKNNSGFLSEYSEYADWIELYNRTNEPLSLSGLYLSDKADNLKEFAFPQDIIIGAHGYLVIIADEKASTSHYLHCNFKLSADGEVIILSNGNGEIIDNIAFGAQTTDVPMGRCPNATGEFDFFSEPTMGEANCSVGIGKLIDYETIIREFPNPSDGSITIYLTDPELVSAISVDDLPGRIVCSVNLKKQPRVEGLAPGL